MKADDLTNWDAMDLARILAEKYTDAFEMYTAFPSMARIETFDLVQFPDFVKKNWRFILSSFDLIDLISWRKQKEEEEEIEKLDNEQDQLLIEEEEAKKEYEDAVLEEYCIRVSEIATLLRRRDLGEVCGFPPKRRLN